MADNRGPIGAGDGRVHSIRSGTCRAHVMASVGAHQTRALYVGALARFGGREKSRKIAIGKIEIWRGGEMSNQFCNLIARNLSFAPPFIGACDAAVIYSPSLTPIADRLRIRVFACSRVRVMAPLASPAGATFRGSFEALQLTSTYIEERGAVVSILLHVIMTGFVLQRCLGWMAGIGARRFPHPRLLFTKRKCCHVCHTRQDQFNWA